MIKLVYLGLSILEISKAATYEFWYDYLKPKIRQKKLCYMDTEKRKIEDIYEQKIFLKALQKMLIKKFIFQIMS